MNMSSGIIGGNWMEIAWKLSKMGAVQNPFSQGGSFSQQLLWIFISPNMVYHLVGGFNP
jgi:hypothetical protein